MDHAKIMGKLVEKLAALTLFLTGSIQFASVYFFFSQMLSNYIDTLESKK